MHEDKVTEILNVWSAIKVLSPFAAMILGALTYYLRDISKSLRDINITQARVLEKIDSHDERIKRLENSKLL